MSERDGWRHAYAVSRATGAARLITPGAFDVNGVVLVDDKGGWLYYNASPTNATQQYLWRTRIDGKGKAERLTPMDQPGGHRYTMSPDAKYAFHSWSSFDTPGPTELVSLPKHKIERTLAANTELIARAKEAITQPGEFFQVKIADGSTLDGWMIKPKDFDPSKRYPMLMYVYGEPAGTTVQDSWGGSNRLWYQTLADQGYLVASVDNMGTPAPQGPRLAQGGLRADRRPLQHAAGGRRSRRSPAPGRTSTPRGSASGAGAAAGRPRCRRCSGIPTSIRWG